jgi:predicted nucleic-acid-binding Zn-ribbon protein
VSGKGVPARKNTGSCPKCHSSDVARVPAEPGRGHALTGPPGVVTSVAMTRFVCCRCGYTEEWVEAAEDLAAVKRRYGMLPGPLPRGAPPPKG